MKQSIHTIATHPNTHIDEEFAILLLKDYGGKKYLGIADANVVYWQAQGEEVSLKKPDDYEKEGILLIGIGGGRFDEHPNQDEERKEDECTATLVAKDLGLFDEPWLEAILKFVKNNDLKGSAHPFDLASMTKLLHESYSPEEVREWLFVGLREKIKEQRRYFEQTRLEFEKMACIKEMVGPHRKTHTIVFIESDDNLMGKFARSNANASIVVQKRSTGNVQIWTNAKHGLTLYDVVSIIRINEQLRNRGIGTKDWKKLSSEGKIEGVEEWFFFEKGQMLLNGSLTAPDTQPTRLSLPDLESAIRIGINPNLFYSYSCDKKGCHSSPKKPCPWYAYGLSRCRKIRYNAMAK